MGREAEGSFLKREGSWGSECLVKEIIFLKKVTGVQLIGYAAIKYVMLILFIFRNSYSQIWRFEALRLGDCFQVTR